MNIPADLANANVLVVEDEPLIAMALESDLDDLGFRSVQSVRSSDAAQAVLNRGPIHLAVLDIHLSGNDTSFVVADRLIADGIPFIFASGSIGAELPEKFRSAPFISKPFLPATLRDALLALLGQDA